MAALSPRAKEKHRQRKRQAARGEDESSLTLWLPKKRKPRKSPFRGLLLKLKLEKLALGDTYAGTS